MAKAASFTAATSTPAAAAARSLARTASICSPSRDRRNRMTANAAGRPSSTRRNRPNPPVGILPSPRKNSLLGPNSMPEQRSGGSVDRLGRPPQAEPARPLEEDLLDGQPAGQGDDGEAGPPGPQRGQGGHQPEPDPGWPPPAAGPPAGACRPRWRTSRGRRPTPRPGPSASARSDRRTPSPPPATGPGSRPTIEFCIPARYWNGAKTVTTKATTTSEAVTDLARHRVRGGGVGLGQATRPSPRPATAASRPGSPWPGR